MDTNLATPLAAFAVGLATSLHCAGMCGPLACAMRVNPLHYHLGRFFSYTAAGALCGGFGQAVLGLFKSAPMRIAPWAMVLVLVALAFGLEKRLPQPRWVSRFMLKARLQKQLGLLTVLLPCGPLWLMLGVAAVSGSAINGALLLASFITGTVPLYVLLQSSLWSAQQRLSPLWLVRAQRTMAVVAAALLAWRASLPANMSCH